jgi:hypothetical protein
VKAPRFAPSIVSYVTPNSYVLARTDTQQLPFGDRVGEGIISEIVYERLGLRRFPHIGQ